MDKVEKELKKGCEKIKKEGAKYICFNCKKYQKGTYYCSGCFMAKYCSRECQTQDWTTHKRSCKTIKRLVGTPGFNHRLNLSKFMTEMFSSAGKSYLSAETPGAVTFSVYPWKCKHMVENKLANSSTSARCASDPIKKKVYHYYIIPADSIVDMGNVPPKFIAFIKDRKTYKRFFPLIQMIFKKNGRSGSYEPSSLKFSALTNNLFIQ
jgi:hypothetical protein